MFNNPLKPKPMWIIKPETPEWKRTLKNINPNAIVALTIIGFSIYIVSAILFGLVN